MFGKAPGGRKGKSPPKGKAQQKGYYKGHEKEAWTAGQEATSGWWGGWHEGGAPVAAEQMAGSGMSRRILARDAFVKKFLRPYAAADGRVLYGEGSDQDPLQKAQLRSLLTPEVSELSRRPCWGMSMAGKSVAGLGEALAIKQGDEARQKMAELLSKEKGQEFLEALSDLDYDRHKFAPEDLESKFEAVFTYCKAGRPVPRSLRRRRPSLRRPKTRTRTRRRRRRARTTRERRAVKKKDKPRRRGKSWKRPTRLGAKVRWRNSLPKPPNRPATWLDEPGQSLS